MKQSDFSTRCRKAALPITFLAALVLAPPSSSAQEGIDLERMTNMLSVMNEFYGLMASVHEAARDPEMAALIQMHELQEIYKNRGELREVIPIFKGVLAKSSNPTIRAMAYMKLADTMKKLGETDRAISLLESGLQESIERAAELEKR
jgi:hypothetical protein